MEAMIQIKDVTKTFVGKDNQVEALKGINLSIQKGEIYGIIGMSGAGKSTLVRCLNFLERPTSGTVLIEGKDLAALKDSELRSMRTQIAMIFQHFNLLMQRTVLDNICFPLEITKVPRAKAVERAKELLEIVGLSEKMLAYPAQLSGGQKQRVAIARALASDPKILLCDEATSALDPQTTVSILNLLKQINQELGITIVIITHQMSVVQEICNKVAIIENGHLVEDGTVASVFSKPKSRAAKELIFGQDSKDLAKLEQTVNRLESDYKIRIVFSDNSAFEPVIANMILHFGTPVNILRADTKNVGGVAKGEMILGLPQDRHLQVDMVEYLKEKGLQIQEVTEDV